MRLVALFAALTAVLSFSCSNALIESPAAATTQADRAVTGEPVKLFYAQSFISQSRWQNSASIWFEGKIEIANLAFAKQVTVFYENAAGAWVTAEATFGNALTDNKEVWSFKVDGQTGKAFAIRYIVNGQTYWDNNNGANYKLTAATLPWWGTYNTILFGKSNLLVENAFGYVNSITNTGHFEGTVTLKNLGFQKTVNIIYSTDNWKTTKTLNATYRNLSSDGSLEYWTFVLDFPATPGTTIQYAVCYNVNNTTYWDNNFGKNYQLVLN